MRWKWKKSSLWSQCAGGRPDEAEAREEWKQSLAVVPDFDLSSIDSDSKIDALQHSKDLVLKSKPDEG